MGVSSRAEMGDAHWAWLGVDEELTRYTDSGAKRGVVRSLIRCEKRVYC